MNRRRLREVLLNSFADFCNGMSTAWAFVSFDSLFHFRWSDLPISFLLAILALTVSVGIKLKLEYDKHTRSH